MVVPQQGSACALSPGRLSQQMLMFGAVQHVGWSKGCWAWAGEIAQQAPNITNTIRQRTITIL